MSFIAETTIGRLEATLSLTYAFTEGEVIARCNEIIAEYKAQVRAEIEAADAKVKASLADWATLATTPLMQEEPAPVHLTVNA